jgi:hypothetical protein
MGLLEREYGLAGTVYITADLHPELRKIAGHDAFMRRFPTVRYIVASEDHPVFAKKKTMGMNVVSSVPWKQALKVYAPALEAKGKRIASNLDPKIALQVAILSAPEEKKVAATNFPIHKEAEVSTEDALRALKAMTAKEQLPFDLALKQSRKAAATESIEKESSRLLTAGKITTEEYQKLRKVSSVRLIHDYLVLRERKTLVKKGQFSGTNEKGVYQSTATPLHGHDVTAFDQNKAQAIKAERGTLVKSGTFSGTNEKAVFSSTATREHGHDLTAFEQDKIRASLDSRARAGSLSDQDRAKVAELKDAWIRKARTIMATGLCGKALSAEMHKQIPAEIREVIKEDLVEARRTHEAASGFKYVDAGAYGDSSQCKTAKVSKQARVVLACGACNNCPYNRGGACSVFKRKLASSVSVPMEERKSTIRTANSHLVSSTVNAPTFTDTIGLQSPAMTFNDAPESDSFEILMEFTPVDAFDV